MPYTKIHIKKISAMAILAGIGAAAISVLLYAIFRSYDMEIWLAAAISAVIFGGMSYRIPRQLLSTIKLINAAAIDPLTELPNRIAFVSALNSLIVKSEKNNQKFHILIMDLNKFKQVNDTLGHSMGDRVLQTISEKLKESIRNCDFLARLGGDEFAVLVPESHVDAKSHEPLAARIIKNVNSPMHIDETFLYTGVSIGIATYPAAGITSNELMRRADIAMYAAKASQKDYAVYKDELDTFNVSDLTLLGEIRNAIDHNEFALWYQPKKNSKTSNIDSVECLVRWNHPTRGILGPFQFIPAAESSGLIKFITQFVIKQAAISYRTLVNAGYDFDISINISPNDIVDPTMMATIIKSIVKSDMEPNKLILEVTETTIMHDPDTAFKVLTALQSLGIKISIDDFGTGHSSMTYLKNFPIGEVKLDRSFITDIDSSPQGYSIVRSTIDLSHELNATTVGEGVETAEVEEMLNKLGCDYIQGYFIAKPMPLDKLIEWLKIYNTRILSKIQ